MGKNDGAGIVVGFLILLAVLVVGVPIYTIANLLHYDDTETFFGSNFKVHLEYDENYGSGGSGEITWWCIENATLEVHDKSGFVASIAMVTPGGVQPISVEEGVILSVTWNEETEEVAL